MHYKFTETEIKNLLKNNFMILYDTREQVNKHVLEYFATKKITCKKQKIDEGDYTAIITKCPELGINRDLYFPVAVERKNSIDELAGNLGEKTEKGEKVRIERELIRAKAKGIKIFLLIEDPNGFQKIREGNYRSQYNPKAFLGRLTSMQDQYLNGTIFTNATDTGFHIHRILYYSIRNFLKEYCIDQYETNEQESV